MSDPVATPVTVTSHEHRGGTVAVLTMDHGENRWNTSFSRAFDSAIDEVLAIDGPVTMVTASTNEKFFSNGLDLAWITGQSDAEADGGDRRAFNNEVMGLFARLITLPIPTVCAIGGHAFGAGLMIALCHDIRVMREDRGFLCANELELGFAIPEPELALFAHKMSPDAFHQTTVLAKRWTAAEAQAAGIVQDTVPLDRVVEAAIERAEPGDHRLDEGASVRPTCRGHLRAPWPRLPVASPCSLRLRAREDSLEPSVTLCARAGRSCPGRQVRTLRPGATRRRARRSPPLRS